MRMEMTNLTAFFQSLPPLILDPSAPLLGAPRFNSGLSITRGSSSKSVMDSLKGRIDSCSLVGRLVSRIALIVSEPAVARRKIISVANRVQRLSFLRNGISVSASRTELFPDDQSPQTTSWRSDRMLSRPYLGSWAIMSRCTW